VPPSSLEGVRGDCAVLYRALRGVLTPAELDELELWQIAVLLGEDEQRDYDGTTFVAPPPQPDGAPLTGPVLRSFD
jgi:hypothetical protein